MSWHPYRRNSRLWTIYWDEHQAKSVSATKSDNSALAAEMLLFELTEPYSLNRDEWRELQLWLFYNLTPANYTLNISQLWGRNWPRDASFRFNRINDTHKLPNLLTNDCYRNVQPGKREGFYWVMAETKPDREILNDLIWFQGVDFENITWITSKPIEPFPTQLFEFNKVALGYRSKEVTNAEFEEVIREECWASLVTDYGHIYLRIPTSSLNREQVWDFLNRAAVEFNLEIESTPFSQKPAKPSVIKGLADAPANLLMDGWQKLNRGFKR